MSEEEVKVTYSPFKEVVIFEYTQYPLDLFVGLEGMPMRAGQLVPPLNWAEGVVFRHIGMPPQESILDEMRKGRIFWTHVAFALMPEYKPQVTTKDGKITMNVLNRTGNPALRAAAKWLREHTEEF